MNFRLVNVKTKNIFFKVVQGSFDKMTKQSINLIMIKKLKKRKENKLRERERRIRPQKKKVLKLNFT